MASRPRQTARKSVGGWYGFPDTRTIELLLHRDVKENESQTGSSSKPSGSAPQSSSSSKPKDISAEKPKPNTASSSTDALRAGQKKSAAPQSGQKKK